MRIKHLAVILVVLATVPLSKAGPGVSYFFKLDGIDGEASDKGHEKEIQLSSYAWGGVLNPAPTGPAGGGKVTVSEITVTKNVDKSSPKLMSACVTGSHIKNGIITMRRGNGNGNVEFLVVKLKDVIITSFQTSGDGDNVIDKITLSFLSISIQTADGSSGQVDLDPFSP